MPLSIEAQRRCNLLTLAHKLSPRKAPKSAPPTHDRAPNAKPHGYLFECNPEEFQGTRDLLADRFVLSGEDGAGRDISTPRIITEPDGRRDIEEYASLVPADPPAAVRADDAELAIRVRRQSQVPREVIELRCAETLRESQLLQCVRADANTRLEPGPK